MPIKSDDPDAPKRRPAFRGILMHDVSQGKERVRKWPRSRGRNRHPNATKTQDEFTAMQRATKFMAPQIYAAAIEATKGTPLLPRDLMTMMMSNRLWAFVQDNGKVLYPMPAVRDVSEALDVLGQNEGDVLVRRNGTWTGEPGSNDAGLSIFTETYDLAGLTEWESPEITQYSMMAVWLDAINTVGDTRKGIQFREVAGGPWDEEADHYTQYGAAGDPIATDGRLYPENTDRTTGQSSVTLFFMPRPTGDVFCMMPQRQHSGAWQANGIHPHSMRLTLSKETEIESGRIHLFAI